MKNITVFLYSVENNPLRLGYLITDKDDDNKRSHTAGKFIFNLINLDCP